MKVAFSPRAEAEFEIYFVDGIARFGFRAAENTFRKVLRTLDVALAAHPYLGTFLPARQVYRCVIARTPFVAYYHLDETLGQITVLAMFHGAQDRTEFEAD